MIRTMPVRVLHRIFGYMGLEVDDENFELYPDGHIEASFESPMTVNDLYDLLMRTPFVSRRFVRNADGFKFFFKNVREPGKPFKVDYQIEYPLQGGLCRFMSITPVRVETSINGQRALFPTLGEARVAYESARKERVEKIKSALEVGV